MTGGVRTTTAIVHCAVYRTDGDASVNICLSQPGRYKRPRQREEKRTEFIFTQQ